MLTAEDSGGSFEADASDVAILADKVNSFQAPPSSLTIPL